MTKVITFLTRAAGEDAATFRRRCLEECAPALLRPALPPRRYVLNLVETAVQPMEMAEPWEEGATAAQVSPATAFDVIEEAWVEDVRGFLARAAAAREAAGIRTSRAYAYRVEENVEREYPRTWRDGERAPGVKAVILVRRKEGITPTQFERHWRESHAPLALRHHVGMWKYVRNVVQEILHPSAPVADGIVELHFPTVRDQRERLYDSEEGKAIIVRMRWSSAGRWHHFSRPSTYCAPEDRRQCVSGSILIRAIGFVTSARW